LAPCVAGMPCGTFSGGRHFCVESFGRAETLQWGWKAQSRLDGAKHLGAAFDREQRSAGCGLLLETADELKMPDDPEFRRRWLVIGMGIADCGA